ncbi:hypothetical protein ACPXCD_30280 [Micromonospora zamorensis]
MTKALTQDAKWPVLPAPGAVEIVRALRMAHSSLVGLWLPETAQ